MCQRDQRYLLQAARLALRGHGGAEPNPLVGCVIVSERHEIVGWGHHRTYGGPHAEVVALQRAGPRAANATLYCTLEPCNHQGKTGPCSAAIIAAKIARVVIAQRDPHPPAAGGVERLRNAGIHVDIVDCEPAVRVSDPFVHRLTTGLPWTIVKWAQTLDGKIATRPPHCEGKWISSEASRRMVHRERGRVDAILTGIGTVLRDDPMLTARGVRRRRIARRVIVDPNLRTPLAAKIVTSREIAPTTIICSDNAITAKPEVVRDLQACGVELMRFSLENNEIPLASALRELAKRHDVTNVLVEAGGGLITKLLQHRLVNEAWVFIAPMLLGDDRAIAAVASMTVERLTQGVKLQLLNTRRRSSDIIARYRVGL